MGRAARHYGIALQVGSTLLGHRDNPGQSTACPGNSLHARLGDLATIVGGAPPAPATTGKVQGVVWDLAITDDAGQATALNAKLPGAVVRALQGTTEVARATARDTDAYWSFDVPPGTYTIVATKGGYADGTRQASVTLGGAGWASIGIAPAATASDVSITVVDADTAAPIASATVRFGEDDPVAVDESGVARAARPPGNLRVTVRAEGYAEVVETLTLTAGAPLARTITLTLATVAPPDEPTPEEPPPNEPTPIEPGSDRTRIVIKNAPSAGGGCGCGAVDVSGPAGLATLALLARRRRHHGETR
jgi:hypothetical protein